VLMARASFRGGNSDDISGSDDGGAANSRLSETAGMIFSVLEDRGVSILSWRYDFPVVIMTHLVSQ
jgi:hypothetical protein